MTVPPEPIGPRIPGTKTVLLSFGDHARYHDIHGRSVATFVESVQRPFLPQGLFLWGVTDDTLVHTVRVGNVVETEIGGFAPVPGRFFESGRTFDEIERLAAIGEISVAVGRRLELEMSEAMPGTMISVSISGPFDRLVVWGSTYTKSGPFKRATVSLLTAGGFSGRIDELRLGGVETTIEVVAPDAKTASDLLIGLSSHRY